MFEASAGIVKQSMGARNRVGIGLSYWPARIHRLEESIPGLLEILKIPSLGSLKVRALHLPPLTICHKQFFPSMHSCLSFGPEFTT
jgi:hypothetical protein